MVTCYRGYHQTISTPTTTLSAVQEINLKTCAVAILTEIVLPDQELNLVHGGLVNRKVSTVDILWLSHRDGLMLSCYKVH